MNVVKALFGTTDEARGNQFASQLGRLAVAQSGPERDAAIAAMKQLASQNGNPKLQALVAAVAGQSGHQGAALLEGPRSPR